MTEIRSSKIGQRAPVDWGPEAAILGDDLEDVISDAIAEEISNRARDLAWESRRDFCLEKRFSDQLTYPFAITTGSRLHGWDCPVLKSPLSRSSYHWPLGLSAEEATAWLAVRRSRRRCMVCAPELPEPPKRVRQDKWAGRCTVKHGNFRCRLKDAHQSPHASLIGGLIFAWGDVIDDAIGPEDWAQEQPEWPDA